MKLHEEVEPLQQEGVSAPLLSESEEDLDWQENQRRTPTEVLGTDRAFWGWCSVGTLVCAALVLAVVGVRPRGHSNPGPWQTASTERDRVAQPSPPAVAKADKSAEPAVVPNSSRETSPALRRVATAAER